MKHVYLIYFIFPFFFVGCKKQEEKLNIIEEPKIVKIPNGLDLKYLENPPKTDTMCISDIQKAKRDIEKYSKLYVKTICFGCDNKPFETELEEVLKAKKVKQVIENIGCVGYEGQTQGCYRETINFEMKKMYGQNYFIELEKEAEREFIKNINENNKIVSIYDLEDSEKPKIKNPNIQIENNYYTTIKVNLPFKLETYLNLFVDITFIIEKNGTITNLSVSNWVSGGIDEKFKKEIISKALESLKKDYNYWSPGKYKGNIARTENTLRVSFENKTSRNSSTQ
jgi:hypothetical protein